VISETIKDSPIYLKDESPFAHFRHLPDCCHGDDHLPLGISVSP